MRNKFFHHFQLLDSKRMNVRNQSFAYEIKQNACAVEPTYASKRIKTLGIVVAGLFGFGN